MVTSPRDRKKILFVEDQADHCELAAINLTEYRLVHAHNFAEGLRFATKRYFDLYILDNWLPDGSGVELCRLIREFDPNRPILFCSAAAYASDKRDGKIGRASCRAKVRRLEGEI